MMLKLHFIATLFVIISNNIYSQQTRRASDFPYIPYRYKNVWGYCDTLGNIKIDPKYDKIEFVYGTSFLPVTKNGKKSLLDRNGKPMIGFYDRYGPLYVNFSVGDGKGGTLQFYWVLNNGKAGVVTREGDTIVPVIYDKLFYSRQVKEYQRESTTIIGTIEKNYFLIPLINKDLTPISKKENISIPALLNDPPTFWDPDESSPPESDGMIGMDEGSYLLTPELQNSIKQRFEIDSVDKEPFQVFGDYQTQLPFYRTYKGNSIGFWSNRYFVHPKYNKVLKGSYFRISFIVELGNKFGVVDENGASLVPFKYNEISNTLWGPFITKISNKYGVVIPGNVYPEIKNLYDRIELFQNLTVNEKWSFTIYKIRKNGKEGYLGENGVEYFKE